MAVIHLNETHTMSGEQEIDSIPLQPSLIYFGQMPSKNNGDYAGFKGCISYFQVIFVHSRLITSHILLLQSNFHNREKWSGDSSMF